MDEAVKYYYVINGYGTTRGGFRPFSDPSNPDLALAPDWKADPTIECGNALHIVDGHPLWAHAHVTRQDPVYYEVEPIDPMPKIGGKIRCRGVRKLRVVAANSPEFDQALLADLAKNAGDWRVRAAAAKKLKG
jgi:hypothetical protein